MNIVVFADSTNPKAVSDLERVVRSKACPEWIETVHSFEALSERMHRLPRLLDIAVFLAANREQLHHLIELKEFLDGIPLILILPDQEKETIALAAKLYPSFIATMESDFSLVGAVLKRMIEFRGVMIVKRPY